jgi:integrase
MVEYEHADAAMIARLEVVKGIKASRPGVRTTEKVEDVPEAVVAATLKATRDYELRRAIRVQQLAGMRPGELLAMQVRWLHPHPSGSWSFKPTWTKTQLKLGFRREIPIGPHAQEQLRAQASNMGDEHGLFGSTVPRLGDAADHRPIWRWKTVGGYYQAVRRAWKKAGVPRWHPNQLRHSTLTKATNVAGIDTAASIGGHSDPRTTRKHYFHGQAEPARLWAEEHG